MFVMCNILSSQKYVFCSKNRWKLEWICNGAILLAFSFCEIIWNAEFSYSSMEIDTSWSSNYMISLVVIPRCRSGNRIFSTKRFKGVKCTLRKTFLLAHLYSWKYVPYSSKMKWSAYLWAYAHAHTISKINPICWIFLSEKQNLFSAKFDIK